MSRYSDPPYLVAVYVLVPAVIVLITLLLLYLACVRRDKGAWLRNEALLEEQEEREKQQQYVNNALRASLHSRHSYSSFRKSSGAFPPPVVPCKRSSQNSRISYNSRASQFSRGSQYSRSSQYSKRSSQGSKKTYSSLKETAKTQQLSDEARRRSDTLLTHLTSAPGPPALNNSRVVVPPLPVQGNMGSMLVNSPATCEEKLGFDDLLPRGVPRGVPREPGEGQQVRRDISFPDSLGSSSAPHPGSRGSLDLAVMGTSRRVTPPLMLPGFVQPRSSQRDRVTTHKVVSGSSHFVDSDSDCQSASPVTSSRRTSSQSNMFTPLSQGSSERSSPHYLSSRGCTPSTSIVTGFPSSAGPTDYSPGGCHGAPTAFVFPPKRHGTEVAPPRNFSRGRRSSMYDNIDVSKINAKLYDLTSPEEKVSESAEEPEGDVGSIVFSLELNVDLCVLKVSSISARCLPASKLTRTADPYCVCTLLPERKVRTTKTLRKTTNPEFVVDFLFDIQDLSSHYLEFKMFDYDEYSRHRCIGFAEFNLECLEGKTKEVFSRVLLPFQQNVQDAVAKYGEVQLSMLYLPSAERLTVTVKEARNLCTENESIPDPYVRLTLGHSHKKFKRRKTSLQKQTLCPVWNESFSFDVAKSVLQEAQVDIEVLDDCSPKHVLGKLTVGASSSGAEAGHWNDMLNARGNSGQWHALQM